MKKHGKRMQFDPMTGEPIDPEAKFDPMTGEPIDPDVKFDPMTGEPIGGNHKKPRRNRGKMAVIGVAAGVAVIGLAVFGAVKSGIFLSDTTKVLAAAANTAKDIQYFPELAKMAGIVSSGEYTMTLNAKAQEIETEMQFLKGKSKVQAAADVQLPDVERVSVLAEMDKDEVRVEAPMISDKMFAYNYREEKGGYLGEEEELEYVDELLQSVGQWLDGGKDPQKIWKEFSDALSEEWKEVEFVKTNPEEYEIDGKFRKCKGYTVSITEENMEDLISVTEDVVADYYDSDFYEELLEQVVSEMEYAMEDMPDIDVTCYTYKNKLAAVKMEAESNDIEVHFLGGERRTQNIEISVEDETVIEIEGETKGAEELTTVYLEGEEAVVTEYDSKSGEYEMEIVPNDTSFSGVFLADKKKVEWSVESVEVYGNELGADYLMSFQKGAEFHKFAGEVFDIGEASESELEDLGEEIMEQMEENEDLEDFLYELNYYL